MRKLKTLIATLALVALMAAPVAAQTTTASIGGVSAEADHAFLGSNDATAEVGNLSAEADDDFLFFDDGVFDEDGFLFFD